MKEIRSAVKETILMRGGFGKVLNRDITEIAKRFNVAVFDVMNVFDYFQFSKQQEKFRAENNFR